MYQHSYLIFGLPYKIFGIDVLYFDSVLYVLEKLALNINTIQNLVYYIVICDFSPRFHIYRRMVNILSKMVHILIELTSFFSGQSHAERHDTLDFLKSPMNMTSLIANNHSLTLYNSIG